MSKSTELAKITSIPEGIAKVNGLLKSLEEIQTSVFKTGNTLMAGFPSAVQSETNADTLVKMLSNVMLREEAYNKAADRIAKVHPSVPVFKCEGYTLSEWEADITLKLKINNTKQKYDELNAIKKEYEELMDKEDRVALLNKRLGKV